MTRYARVTADPGRCIGAGQCVMHAPDVFDQDADGVVVVRVDRATPDLWDDVMEAAARCPAEAISVLDS